MGCALGAPPFPPVLPRSPELGVGLTIASLPSKDSMKLYYAPGACSLSPHIVLHEAGLTFTAMKVSTKTHQLADGTDFYSINPLGYVVGPAKPPQPA